FRDWQRASLILHPSSFILLLLLLAPGCSQEPRADLVVHNGTEAETIDPHILTGQPDGRISGALFEGLTRFDERTGRSVPGLAHSWEISPDGLRYTFHLRTNAAFSTGQPIRAEDFVWSWQRAVNPVTAADYSGFFFYLKGGQAIATGATNRLEELGIRAVDPFTVEVTLVNPTPFFPDLCAMRIMAVIPRATVERLGDQWVRADPLPCSGPYQLEWWRPNDRVRLKANPHYWDAANVACERVDMLAGESPVAALNLYLTGDVDFLIDKVVIPSELGDVLVKRPDFQTYDYLGTYFFRFNVTRKPFDDPRVRKAIGLVVDRRRIVERITRMGEQPASTLTPPGTGDYVPPEGLGHEALRTTNAADYATAMRAAVAEAKRLLAEAGYPEGKGFPPFTYMFNVGTRQHENIGVEIQSSLREHLGLRMELRPIEWKTYLSELSQLNYDLARGSWIGDYQDPTTFLDCFLSDSGNNRTGWRNARYDGLIAAAAAEPDSRKRSDLLREAETILVKEEAPLVTIYTYVGMFGYDTNRWEGIYPNLTGEHPVRAIRRRDGVGGSSRARITAGIAPATP
ncbi:MAG: peptide ABC transporter substrate-binding protein, partial [Verrucomicrobiae bacterium]|nr:peptide ABC transporter substrate-binding protein [Verrucomicrobiae bacterium]